MLDALKRLFAGDTTPEETALSPALSTAVLLVEAALSDGVYADAEEAEILGVLQTGFDLSAPAAAELLADAKALADTAVDHYRVTKVVKTLPHDQRISILTDLWGVVLADGDRDAHEDALIRRLAPLLGLSDRDRALARQAASSR